MPMLICVYESVDVLLLVLLPGAELWGEDAILEFGRCSGFG